MSVITTTAPSITEPCAVRRASSLRRATIVAGRLAAAAAAPVQMPLSSGAESPGSISRTLAQILRMAAIDRIADR